MAQSGIQRNNGSPMGYGQPQRKTAKGRGLDDIIMRPEDREIFGYTPPPPTDPETSPTVYSTARQPSGAFKNPAEKQPQSVYNPPQKPQGPTATPPPPSVYPGLATGDAGRGALAQYGTGDIQGVGELTTGGFQHQLEGFNTNGWASGERGSQSIKNAVGRLMTRVDVTQPGAVDQLMALPEFRQLFPMAKKINHPNGDQIDFGDGNGPVDVIRAAVAGGSGAAWQWGAPSTGAQAPQGGPQGPGTAIYNGAFPGRNTTMPVPTPDGLDPTGTLMPETQTADFLEWLLSQQQQQPLI